MSHLIVLTNANPHKLFQSSQAKCIEGWENNAISYFILILIAPIELNN
jgi:hypothetical protein